MYNRKSWDVSGHVGDGGDETPGECADMSDCCKLMLRVARWFRQGCLLSVASFIYGCMWPIRNQFIFCVTSGNCCHELCTNNVNDKLLQA